MRISGFVIFFILTLNIVIRYLFRYLRFLKKFRVIKERNVVVPEYEAPPGLPAAFLSAIVDNRISYNSMVSTLLELHNKKLLDIKYNDTVDDFIILRTTTPAGPLFRHQQCLIDMIGKLPGGLILAKQLSTDQSQYFPSFNFGLLCDLQSEGLYFFDKKLLESNNFEYSSKYISRAIIKGLIKPWNWLLIILSLFMPAFGILWIIVCIFYYARVGIFKNKTEKWEEWWPKVSGYYNYLRMVEAEKRNYEIDKDKKSAVINEIDPYLVAFEMSPAWRRYISPIIIVQ